MTEALWRRLPHYFHSLRRYSIRKMTVRGADDLDSLIYWRANILFGVIASGLITGVFAIAVVVVLAVRHDLWMLPIIGTLAWLGGLLLLFSKRPVYEIRAALISLLFYTLGVTVLVFIGPLSGGPLYLFSFAVFAGILLGLRAALAAVCLNMVTISVISWMIGNGVIARGFPFFKTPEAMIAAGANFIVLNTIAAVSVAALVRGLYQVHIKEKQLAVSLAQEQKRLLTAKKNLEREAEERVQAEASLRESEKNFREMAEMLPETVFEMDIDGKLTFVNNRAFGHFGYSRSDFERGLYALDMIVPEDRPKAGENMRSILKGMATGINEYRVLRKDGSSFIGLFQSAPKLQGGKVAGLRGFVVDVTDKKRLEAQLQQAQKMEAIGTLAGGIAHDFNNILAPIIGYSEICIADLPTDSVHRSHVQQVLNAALRARDLVRQILAFSRQSGQEKKPLQLRLIIKEAMKLLKASIPSIITIRERLTSENVIEADPTQMHQIIMNLCTNAYHAMEDRGGELTIALADLRVDSDDPLLSVILSPGNYLKLSISDTGSGIEPHLLGRIFDPYFTTKDKDKGTGMGLSVVHGIVRAHNGHIAIDSQPGIGTTFHVYLPARAADPDPAAAQPDRMLSQGGREHILLVDDEAAIAQMMRQSLERLGYRVTPQTSSPALLAAFQQNPDRYDLVITDYTMPKMTGEDLVAALRKIRSDIPVILCTGYSEKITPKRAQELGIHRMLFKPFEQSDLAAAVRELLDAPHNRYAA